MLISELNLVPDGRVLKQINQLNKIKVVTPRTVKHCIDCKQNLYNVKSVVRQQTSQILWRRCFFCYRTKVFKERENDN